MYRYLVKDIISHCKRDVVYGRSGDKVLVITNGQDVKIVESENGNRFPCRDEFLSDTKTIGAVVIESGPVKKKSNKALTQAEKLQLEYLNVK